MVLEEARLLQQLRFSSGYLELANPAIEQTPGVKTCDPDRAALRRSALIRSGRRSG